MSMTPRMLVLAREAQGLTQEELARKTGLAQSIISKAEKGGRLLPDSDLPTVARALRVTPQMLCWTDEVYGFGTASFFHRKQQSLPQRTLRKIQARVNLLRMRLVRLSSGIAVDTPLSMPRMDIDEIGSAHEIAAAAAGCMAAADGSADLPRRNGRGSRRHSRAPGFRDASDQRHQRLEPEPRSTVRTQ